MNQNLVVVIFFQLSFPGLLLKSEIYLRSNLCILIRIAPYCTGPGVLLKVADPSFPVYRC